MMVGIFTQFENRRVSYATIALLIFKQSDSETVGMLYVTGVDGREVTKIQTNTVFMV